jgi:hypothetical protein
VVAVGLWQVVSHPATLSHWSTALTARESDPFLMVAAALLVFPRLALGLSGFETGVAVMPHVRGDPADTEDAPAGRVRGTRRLLTTAAVIMSAFLITSSLVTTVLIPERAFEPGGPANGRALAYLAHQHLGSAFGSVYDLSTIAILWFAGASAMAGLLNLVPRYLPRYGMAPGWARAVRPLVLVFTAAAFLITVLFRASVDAQGGAYATGVLVLITSATVAVTLSAARRRHRGRTAAFAVIAVVFGYTTLANVVERPDGVKIGAAFITAILLVSIVSRLTRVFELRATHVQLDKRAELFIRDTASRRIRIIANEPDRRDAEEYRDKIAQIVADNDIPDGGDLIFAEVTVTDPSEFEYELQVHGEVMYGRYRVLTMNSTSVPSALAALLLHIRDHTGRRPHIYFEWTEGHPVANFLRYLIFGQGEVAPVTREVVRGQEPVQERRPHVHVG